MARGEIESEIEDITRQIVAKYKPQKIFLFGSAAGGDYTPDSDLDFLIIKKDVPHFGIDRMREIDRLIERKTAVDMLVYRPEEFEERLRMGDPFIRLVLEKGKVVYG